MPGCAHSYIHPSARGVSPLFLGGASGSALTSCPITWRPLGCIMSATFKLQALHYVVDPRVRHTSRRCTTMLSDDPGYHNRLPILVKNISDLLCSLNSSTYDDIAPKVEYWIEYVFCEGFTTVDELVEGVSPRVWDQGGSYTARFFKEFFDAPRRSASGKRGLMSMRI